MVFVRTRDERAACRYAPPPRSGERSYGLPCEFAGYSYTGSPRRGGGGSEDRDFGASSSLSLLLPTALNGAVTTLPVVDTVVVTMLPAVFTGTVMREQADVLRHRARAGRRLVFMSWNLRYLPRSVIQTAVQTVSAESVKPMAERGCLRGWDERRAGCGHWP